MTDTALDVPSLVLNDGYRMPSLGYGTYLVPEADTARLCAQAIDAGYRAIDTAKVYGNEKGVGEAVRASDQTIFVTTKLWIEDFGADKARRAFDRSFDTLGLDWIDLYMMHWPAPPLGLYVETWKALVDLRGDGRLRSIGVSNFTAAQLERIIDETGVVPVTNQIELHPRFQQVELRAFCQENNITVTAWSPLGQGALLSDPVIGRIAAKHDRTPAQVILRWHLHHDVIVIPKSSSEARMRENADLFGWSLDDDDLAAIATLDAVDGRMGPDPETYTG